MRSLLRLKLGGIASQRDAFARRYLLATGLADIERSVGEWTRRRQDMTRPGGPRGLQCARDEKRVCRRDGCAERLLRRRDWEADMLAWLLWQLEKIERVHAVAGMLMREFGVGAGGEARLRENDRPIAPERRESGDASHRSSPAGVRSPPPSTPQPARHCWNLIRSPTRRGSPRAGRRHSGSNLFAERRIVARRIRPRNTFGRKTLPPQSLPPRIPMAASDDRTAILDREGREVFARESPTKIARSDAGRPPRGAVYVPAAGSAGGCLCFVGCVLSPLCAGAAAAGIYGPPHFSSSTLVSFPRARSHSSMCLRLPEAPLCWSTIRRDCASTPRN